MADDSLAMRKMVVRSLQESGLTFSAIYEASNGAEALKHLAAGSPDVVICDMAMPVMDGLEFLRAAHGTHAGKSARFCILTAMRTGDLLGKLGSIRVDAVINKPFVPSELAETVNRLMTRGASTPGSHLAATWSLPPELGGATANTRKAKLSEVLAAIARALGTIIGDELHITRVRARSSSVRQAMAEMGPGSRAGSVLDADQNLLGVCMLGWPLAVLCSGTLMRVPPRAMRERAQAPSTPLDGLWAETMDEIHRITLGRVRDTLVDALALGDLQAHFLPPTLGELASWPVEAQLAILVETQRDGVQAGEFQLVVPREVVSRLA
ncbi:MAG: response regulator [Pseudomonadota bacterium]